MIRKSNLFIFILFIISFLTVSCRLTRNNVIGTWKSPFDDSLLIHKDNSFVFIPSATANPSQTRLSGQWTLSKKSIRFNFADTSQNFGGGCNTYLYWWTRGSKKKLIRPMNCKSPTNRFVIIRKID